MVVMMLMPSAPDVVDADFTNAKYESEGEDLQLVGSTFRRPERYHRVWLRVIRFRELGGEQ